MTHADDRDEVTVRETASLQRLLSAAGEVPTPVAYGHDPDQVLELYGATDVPLIVVVHGGYFRPTVDRTHARPMARALAASGWQVALAEYRRRPGAPGASITDLALLTEFLADRRVAGWVGHSAGGLLALLRACHLVLPPTRVVALAPVVDLARACAERDGSSAVPEWIGGPPAERAAVCDLVDPIAALARHPEAATRIALVHGRVDDTVSVRHSTDFGPGVTLLEGAHHFDLIDPQSLWWPTVLEVVATHLGGGVPAS